MTVCAERLHGVLARAVRKVDRWAPATAPSDSAKLNQIYSTLEKDFLQQQPEIPLWYNGIWFQGNTQYWSSFPSSTGSNQNIPAMWYGYLGAMTTVPALAQLTPTPQKAS